MNTKKKFGIGFAVVVLLLVLSAGAAIWAIHRINAAMDEAALQNHKLVIAREIKEGVDNVVLHLGNMALSENKEDLENNRQAILDLRKVYRAKLDELKASVQTSTGRVLLDSLERAIADLKRPHDRVLDLVSTGKMKEAAAIYIRECSLRRDDVTRVYREYLNWRMKRLSDVDHQAEGLVSSVTKSLVGLALLAIVLAVGLGVVITRSIANPLSTMTRVIRTTGGGDLTQESQLRSADEFGEMGTLLDKMIENIRSIVGQIASNSSALSIASEAYSAYAAQIATNSAEMMNKPTTAAAGAEQSTAGLTSISASAEQMSASVNIVATAIEEMSASINEVAKSCQNESTIAAKADTQARATQDLMERLGASAKEIGKVVDIINDIADQTNLLALNATIEAASAGEAGKGFAVVANEVKELARQTAQATEQISTQIEEMQGSADGVVKAIQQIASIIEEINTISKTIVGAVQQQSATVNEIAKSIGGSNSAAAEIAKNVTESAKGLTEVSSSIQEVNTLATNTSNDIAEMKNSLQELSQMANGLHKIVAQFKIK